MNVFRVLSIGTRVLALGFVASSPWLAPSTKAVGTQSIVYVVDASASMGEDGVALANDYLGESWRKRTGEHLGVVAFAGHAEVVAPVGAVMAPSVSPLAEGNATDLAGAIRLAAASLPAEGHRSIVVLGDFRPTRGNADAEVRRVAGEGIRVDVVPLEGPKPSGVLVTSMKPKSTHVAEHQPVSFEVEVRADTSFVLAWSRDGVPMRSERHYLRSRSVDDAQPAPETITLTDQDPPPGAHVYEAHAEPWQGYRYGSAHKDDDAKPSASVMTAVSVDGKAYAAVFSSSGEVPAVLADALKQAGLDARRLPLEAAADPATYSGADLVVLADVRASAAAVDDAGLTHAAQTALVDYVQQGGGLLTTGGVFGLAPEYANTPLARAIPVQIEDRGHVEDPPVSLAIMLDRSGSMAAMVGEHTKLDLAIEASLGAAEVLRPTDIVALASVDTVTHWDIPLGPQSRVPELKESVRRVGPGGGGIYVYTALKDAYEALKDSKTPIRHVILFSDTSDSEQQGEDCDYAYAGGACRGKTAETLAREARKKGITTTVVGIGEESASDTPFLRRLAAAAGGRFYITSEGTDLRRIFLSETRVLAQSNLRERRANVLSTGPHPALEGVNADKLPALAAYVETGRRAGADTALVLPDGRPFLATWRYGLGKSGAIATDFSEGWGGEWATSKEAAQLLRQSLRYLLRQSDARRGDASVTVNDRQVEVDIQLPPDAPASSAPTALDVYAVDKSGRSHTIPLHLAQRGPGHWVARGRTNGEPVVIARARDARGALMAEGLGREDRAAEISGDGADTYFAQALATIADGRFAPTPAESLARTARPARALVATWPYALVAAAFLVILDLIFRRLADRSRATFGAPARIDAMEAPPLRAAA